ncbi:phosphoenolpyruvate synthase [Enterovibrio sp. ZSDZ35]|uniref:Phosphoenolpyruvate synthase n=1 Tax=Enterovibrio qingdaonensis TaxID=2899818 RepID=A0ABT5QIZ2_9GAMM|nr:putative PEP-binding protein [Enterovibrio sp. ZSDZ35]MDD1780648.1 phosphoenolpyruvate synthase [Enterovibrio sp. ZSDZ35]
MSQMDLNSSLLLKHSSQLDAAEANIGLVALAGLYQELVGEHPSVLSDTESAVNRLVEALDKASKANGGRALRILLNDEGALYFSALKGGEVEPAEANPAMGLRGVSRFASQVGKPGFIFECNVLKSAIEDKNIAIEIVVPFIRTSSEAATMIDLLAEQGLCRGAKGLKVLLACQLPSNALLAESLLAYFDGVIIDVDCLASFTLGVDFDCTALPYIFTKHNEAVRGLILDTIKKTQSSEKPVLVLLNEQDKKVIELVDGAGVELIFK